MSKVHVFLQSEFLADVEALQLDASCGPAVLTAECLARLRDKPQEPVFLFIEDEDDEQAVQKIDRIPDGLRVHLHRLKGIDVIVRYAGREVRRAFRPSTTVGRVKTWATAELGIPQADAAELMLQVSGTNNRPDADVHVGALAHGPQREISFDLVPSPRVNG